MIDASKRLCATMRTAMQTHWSHVAAAYVIVWTLGILSLVCLPVIAVFMAVAALTPDTE